MRLWLLVAALMVAWSTSGRSQQQIGSCEISSEYAIGSPPAEYVIYSNGLTVQTNLPPGFMNNGLTVRDPSGITALRLQAADPMNNAYYVTWNGEVVHLSIMAPPRLVGRCSFMPGSLGSAPQAPQIAMSESGVSTPSGFQRVPDALVLRKDGSYAPPLLVSPADTQSCLDEADGNQDNFSACMVKHLGDDKTQGMFACSQSQKDMSGLAICTLGVMGGSNEKQMAARLMKCHDDNGDDYTKYPGCMAGSAGGEAGRAMKCLEKETTSAADDSDGPSAADEGGPSLTGFAVCYSGSLLHMNAEAQVTVECAATTGGVPMAFAVCTGGRLTGMEFDKCFKDGVGGGSGCFGENNTIVLTLKKMGLDLQKIAGPDNEAVKAVNTALNDLHHGPGEGNDLLKAGREISSGLNQLGKSIQGSLDTVNNIIPGVRPPGINIVLPHLEEIRLPKINKPPNLGPIHW